jgi:hypothetical protein
MNRAASPRSRRPGSDLPPHRWKTSPRWGHCQPTRGVNPKFPVAPDLWMVLVLCLRLRGCNGVVWLAIGVVGSGGCQRIRPSASFTGRHSNGSAAQRNYSPPLIVCYCSSEQTAAGHVVSPAPGPRATSAAYPVENHEPLVVGGGRETSITVMSAVYARRRCNAARSG